MDKNAAIFELKISLKGIVPQISRKFQVNSSITLLDFHEVLQDIMGWENGHLFSFSIQGVELDCEDKKEMATPLYKVLPEPKYSLIYLYDFGDNWEHKVVLNKILDPNPQLKKAKCLSGKRSCPPEDCGGVGGYEEFLVAIKDPKHPEHEEFLEWIGEDFDPEYFSVDEANEFFLNQINSYTQGIS